jgi:hypothetical protein
MTADERLKGPRLKVERANAHIVDLQRAVEAFLETNPYTVATKRHPQTGQLLYYMKGVEPPPPAIALMIGDILFNLRSALDHLAVQFLLKSNPAAPTYDVYFPVYKDATEYGQKAPRRIRGLPQDAVDFINAAKPYKGGNEDIWRLNKLNNIDKHRLLITAVGRFGAFAIVAPFSEVLKEFPGRKITWPRMEWPIKATNPLKAGDVLLARPKEAEPDDSQEFRFEVAIHEPGVAEMEPIPALLRQFSSTVNSLLDASAPLFQTP